MAIATTVQIGGLSLGSTTDGADGDIVSASIERRSDGWGSHCRCDIVRPANAPAVGDPFTITMSADSATPVFAGVVHAVRGHGNLLSIDGIDALGVLAHRTSTATFEEMTAGDIIAELAGEHGQATGSLAGSPALPFFHVHPTPSVLGHCQRLAQLAGGLLYTDGNGVIQAPAWSDLSSAEPLVYGDDILQWDLHQVAATDEPWRVVGEGAAPGQGSDAASWLAGDLGAVSATAGSSHGRIVHDGAIRDTEAAETMATGLAEAAAARPLHGHITILGRPTLEAGQRVQLDGFADHLPQHAEVFGSEAMVPTCIRHRLSAVHGLTTTVVF